jgi:hypothetical protein
VLEETECRAKDWFRREWLSIVSGGDWGKEQQGLHVAEVVDEGLQHVHRASSQVVRIPQEMVMQGTARAWIVMEDI